MGRRAAIKVNIDLCWTGSTERERNVDILVIFAVLETAKRLLSVLVFHRSSIVLNLCQARFIYISHALHRELPHAHTEVSCKNMCTSMSAVKYC